MTNLRLKTVDPTHKNLTLALLDQNVAGTFYGKRYAYTAIMFDDEDGCGLGIAVANESGYFPIPSSVYKTKDYNEAANVADGMNLHIGLSNEAAIKIVASTMH